MASVPSRIRGHKAFGRTLLETLVFQLLFVALSGCVVQYSTTYLLQLLADVDETKSDDILEPINVRDHVQGKLTFGDGRQEYGASHLADRPNNAGWRVPICSTRRSCTCVADELDKGVTQERIQVDNEFAR